MNRLTIVMVGTGLMAAMLASAKAQDVPPPDGERARRQHQRAGLPLLHADAGAAEHSGHRLPVPRAGIQIGSTTIA
jgi:hypothetical protein